MFYFGRDGDNGAGSHFYRLLAPFLIPAATGDADQYLHLFVMDMPIVTTARLEGDVHHTTTNISQIALAYEVLAIRIWFALGPLGAQGVAFFAEPCAEFIDQLLTVAHIYGTLLVGGELWNYTFETTQGSYGNYLTIGSRELIASEDVTKEV